MRYPEDIYADFCRECQTYLDDFEGACQECGSRMHVDDGTAWTETRDQAIDDLLLGSGALGYPWWLAMTRWPDGKGFTLAGVSAEDDRTTVQRYFSWGDVRKAHGALPMIVPWYPRDWHDLDADDADCFLQHLMYGEVVFS